ncbi:MAG TPA: helix-turn-helix domain-containing protein [Acidimicrobiales bacterium]|nr:helix-turn-helix domain-containing protein [Acidimicrobiales bacterium]
MSAPDAASIHDDRPAIPTAAQARVIDAALCSFARHGVGGTSLQMIADELGVTKAALYFQYRTRDEIVFAAAEAELARVETVAAAAEAQPSKRRAREAAIRGIVDLAIERRRTVGSLLSDPVIAGLFREHEHFHDVMQRLRDLLVEPGAGPEGDVRLAMLVAAISGAVTHPYVVDLDDEILRAELLRLAHRFLGLRR